jgi:preprotein translocase subunit Sss1
MAEVGSYCTHCGARIDPNSMFCSSCGRATFIGSAQETTKAAVPPASRPDGVTIIAILSILAGIGAFFLGAIGGTVGVILIPIGIVYFVVAYGLFKGRPWAWTLTVILSIISIVLNVITIAILSVLSIINIVFSGIILYYVYRAHVKAYFGKTVSSISGHTFAGAEKEEPKGGEEKRVTEQEPVTLSKGFDVKETEEDKKEKALEKEEKEVKYLKPTADASPPPNEYMHSKHARKYKYKPTEDEHKHLRRSTKIIAVTLILIGVVFLISAIVG